MLHPCYLDWNAAAPPHPLVLKALADASTHARNPSSPHVFGRAARSAVERARRTILKAADAQHMKCVFTSSGTEANNTALLALGFTHMFVSAGEHASVTVHDGATVIALNAHGQTDTDALKDALAACPDPSSAIVSVMAANNETGVIQDITAYAAVTKAYGATLHCDASQAFGKIPFSAKDSGADIITLSAHKAGGIAGAAALLLPPAQHVHPLIKGGGQEGGARSGTENTLAIEMFGIVAEQITAIQSGFTACEAPLRTLEKHMRETAGDRIRIYGEHAKRLPNTLCVATQHIGSETQLIACDLAGCAISAGSACSSGKITASPVLRAMDHAAGHSADDGFTGCAVRVSLGNAQDEKETQRFFNVWKGLFDASGA